MSGINISEKTPNSATKVSATGRGFLAVTNLDGNTGYIYVGDSALTSSLYLIRLVPGDVFELQHENDIDVYLLNSVSGEKCEITTWT